MTIGDFFALISSYPEDKVFQFSLSQPFPFIADKSCVAFSLKAESMSRNTILANIESAYNMTFSTFWRKGIKYTDKTEFYFEAGPEYFSDGAYTLEWIQRIYQQKNFESFEDKLIQMMFK